MTSTRPPPVPRWEFQTTHLCHSVFSWLVARRTVPGAGRRQREIGYAHAIGGRPELRFLSNIADQRCFVQTPTHVTSRRWVVSVGITESTLGPSRRDHHPSASWSRRRSGIDACLARQIETQDQSVLGGLPVVAPTTADRREPTGGVQVQRDCVGFSHLEIQRVSSRPCAPAIAASSKRRPMPRRRRPGATARLERSPWSNTTHVTT